jgi:hypothetical protein
MCSRRAALASCAWGRRGKAHAGVTLWCCEGVSRVCSGVFTRQAWVAAVTHLLQERSQRRLLLIVVGDRRIP